jgi:GDP-4-dehydro-6-deoxy-D-mannose reductase
LGLSSELRSSLRVFADRITYYKYDLAGSADTLTFLLEKHEIDGIIHLAGLTVSNDWSALLQTNVLGTVNLLKTVLRLRETWKVDPPVLIVSSSAAYGIPVSEDSPLSEGAGLCPVTPYGVSKAAQELVANRFFVAEGMKIIIVRAFNLVGPGQSPDFVCSSIARQIASAEARGESAHVQLGRLDTQRDFIDVRDAVELYATLLQGCSYGHVYNCGSGVTHSIAQVVEFLRKLASVEVVIEQKENLIRSGDIRSQRADIVKALATGWKPSRALTASLSDLLDSWRRRVASEI